MKYLNVWKDIHPKINKNGIEYFINFLIDYSKVEPIGLMCAEEASLHKFIPFLDNENFLNIKNIHVVNGGYDTNYYNTFFNNFTNITQECWPLYFLYETFYHNTFDPTHNKIDRLFLCMNYRPRLHRKKLLDELSKANLLKNNYFTWHDPKYNDNFTPDFDEGDYNWKYWMPEKTILNTTWDQYAPPLEIYKSAISLITESFLHCPFVTEKTWNAIISKRPFIILGAPGIHNYLESLGFILSDEIDYSFDKIVDNDDRIKAIVRELQRLNCLDIQEFFQKTVQVNEHNYCNAIKIIKSEKHSIHVAEHYKNIIERTRYKINEL